MEFSFLWEADQNPIVEILEKNSKAKRLSAKIKADQVFF